MLGSPSYKVKLAFAICLIIFNDIVIRVLSIWRGYALFKEREKVLRKFFNAT